MKTLLNILLSMVFIVGSLRASTLSLDYITQPICFGSDGVKYKSIPKIVTHFDYEFKANLYSSPTRAEGHEHDLNLISLCKVSVSLTTRAKLGQPRLFTVDISKAVIPKGVGFTPIQIGQMAVKSVRLDFSDRKLTQIVVFDGSRTIKEEAKK